MPKIEARAKPGRKKVRPMFQIDMGLDFDLDFDPDDFDLIDEKKPRKRGEKQRDVRILRPRMDREGVTIHRAYENAEAFARQIDLTPGSRTFAWVSGNFVFGDIIEALVTERKIGIRRLYVCSLSIGQDSIDSLKNVMLLMGDRLEKLTLILSGFQYSHQKYDLVPYMYRELDGPDNRVQIAFGRYHAKIITLETVHGHTLTIHGSANVCSNGSIEQIMVECDDRELHEFNARIMDDIARRFGTINYGAEYSRLKAVERQEAWEIAQSAADEGGNGAWQAVRQAAAEESPEAAESGA